MITSISSPQNSVSLFNKTESNKSQNFNKLLKLSVENVQLSSNILLNSLDKGTETSSTINRQPELHGGPPEKAPWPTEPELRGGPPEKAPWPAEPELRGNPPGKVITQSMLRYMLSASLYDFPSRI